MSGWVPSTFPDPGPNPRAAVPRNGAFGKQAGLDAATRVEPFVTRRSLRGTPTAESPALGFIASLLCCFSFSPTRLFSVSVLCSSHTRFTLLLLLAAEGGRLHRCRLSSAFNRSFQSCVISQSVSHLHGF